MAHIQRNTASIRARLTRGAQTLRNGAGKTITVAIAALVVAGLVAAFAMRSHGAGVTGSGMPRTSIAPTATPPASGTCGTPTTPACTHTPGDWIPIAADTPAAVLVAFKKSGLYAAAQIGTGDGTPDLSRPETPVFERELHVPGGLIVPDMYVIPFDTSAGSIGWFALCNVNVSHTAIEAGEVVAGVLPNGQPRPHGQLTPITAPAAVAAVHAQRRAQMKAGAQPTLYFVEINATLIETGQVKWSAPAGPQNPYWFVPGADGHDYLVDTTGAAHLVSEVPVEMAQ